MRWLSIVGWLCLFSCAFATEPEIRLVDQNKAPVAFEVVGMPAQHLAALAKLPADDEAWPRTLSVYVGKTVEADQPAIAGTYAISKDVLRFTPRFPLKGGLSYRAEVFLPAANSSSAPARYEKVFTLVAPPRPAAAKVVAAYPSAATLPDNHLRFYLHFSAPMSRGEAYEHLALLKANGEPVLRPFLEIGEELWDNSGKRLTLLLDPGRVKRGLSPREEHGPILETGGKYTLVITKGWRDASGQPLTEDFKKSFSAGPPVEAAIDYEAWKIAPPAAGTSEPLVVRFPTILDHALLHHAITVSGPGGTEFAGQITVGKDERLWQFKPDQPWQAGRHELVIDTTLEDVAGNRIGRPFEVDQFEKIDKTTAPEFVRLPFDVRPASK